MRYERVKSVGLAKRTGKVIHPHNGSETLGLGSGRTDEGMEAPGGRSTTHSVQTVKNGRLRLSLSLMQKNKRQVSTHLGRLKLVGAGLALGGIGVARMLRGIQVVTHWTGQPMFSWGLVAGGTLCILLAVIPVSWLAKAARFARLKARGCH
jgi:hypothetical protein